MHAADRQENKKIFYSTILMNINKEIFTITKKHANYQ